MRLQAEFTKKVKTETIEISLDLENEVLGILGRSGCGKSVTLRCLAGILRPDRGRILLDGKALFDSGGKVWKKPQERKIGYLFQNYALFPNMTVRENIAFAMGGKKDVKVIRDMLERFYLEEVAEQYPSLLSGGQQQRTAMARMLAARPSVILLDEPFSALDSFLRQEMEREVRDVLESFGGISILVSHNKEEIFRLTQKCMVMEAGHMAELGETKQIFADPQTAEGKLLIQGVSV